MLKLKNIIKNYELAEVTVEALKGINIKFRENEFVSILGPSGCGKTTLLNLLGGLDRYTDGDIVINGKSTKDFNDRDWDTYRNRKIGFVFQNYNLITHQTVLSNVELAMTLSGVSKSERRRRAIEVLEKVGLGDQINKKPGQMSGGQMQRVSIARALVNNPEILLADEPTGALDSGTSVQIMELIKEIAKERLVIMVTHNQELAEQYSTRIIKLFDGKLVDDSNPIEVGEMPDYDKTKKRKKPKASKKKTSMTFFTALSLSANNLLTKKGRTFMTAFAGSIGIIGIALILSLSSGSQDFITKVQEDTLSTFPITIDKTSTDITAIMSAMRDTRTTIPEHDDPDAVYSHNIINDMLNSMMSGRDDNDLAAFMQHLESNREELAPMINAISYTYDINLNVFASDYSDGVRQVNPSNLFPSMGGGTSDSGMGLASMRNMNSMSVWTELLDNQALLESQYDVVAGRWATDRNEVVLIVDEHNTISDLALYSLGLMDSSDIEEMLKAMSENREYDTDTAKFSYEELLDLTYKMVLSPELYKRELGEWVNMSNDEDFMINVLGNAMEIKVVGIIRPNEDSTVTAVSGTIGYLHSLTEYIINEVNAHEMVIEQRANPEINVFTGLPFESDEDENEGEIETTENNTAEEIATMLPEGVTLEMIMSGEVDISTLPQEVQIMIMEMQAENELSPEQQEAMAAIAAILPEGITLEMIMSGEVDITALPAEVLTVLSEVVGEFIDDDEKLAQFKSMAEVAVMLPEGVTIAMVMSGEFDYTELSSDVQSALLALHNSSNQTQEVIIPSYEGNLELLGVVGLDSPSTISIYPKDFASKEAIEDFITDYNEANPDSTIGYTDFVGMMMSSVSTIIDMISSILIAFVGISLVVSSIMIGIITYVSVLERTREIGILKSIGASKKDITRVFNAETLIVGFTAGSLGIIVTLLLLIPANMIIKAVSGVAGLAVLPVMGALALIGLSMLLTVIAGFIPSKVAARKDPVVALRSE